MDGIVIFGANGCGKTTLGCEIARILGFQHIDVENYYFDETDISHRHPHRKEDVIRRILHDIDKRGSFVFSGVTGDYGERIASMYTFGVFLSAPAEVRMERIRKRTISKYGERAMPGGDIYDDTEGFIRFARERDLSFIEKWNKTLACPVIRLDASAPVSQNAKDIIDVYRAEIGSSSHPVSI